MSKLADILGKVGKTSSDPLTKAAGPLEEDEADAEGSEDVSEEEVEAMKLFSKASTPEQKADALKMFLKACGVY